MDLVAVGLTEPLESVHLYLILLRHHLRRLRLHLRSFHCRQHPSFVHAINPNGILLFRLQSCSPQQPLQPALVLANHLDGLSILEEYLEFVAIARAAADAVALDLFGGILTLEGLIDPSSDLARLLCR